MARDLKTPDQTLEAGPGGDAPHAGKTGMTGMSKGYLIGSMAALAAFGAAAEAKAQSMFQRDRYENVRERYQRDFDPEPLRLGGFITRPVLELGAESDDNAFADPEDEQSDVIATARPRIDLVTDWSRNQLGATVEVERREYLDISSESVTNFRGGLRGRLDIGSDLNLTGAVSFADENEERGSVAALDTFAEPVNVQFFGGEVGARFTRDRIQLRADLSTRTLSYDDVPLVAGGTADQGFRDYTENRLRTRAAYAISPDIAVFAQAVADQRVYDELSLVDGELVSRDSNGYAFQVGTDFELPALLRGDVAVGYLQDNKDSDMFADFDGPAVDASVEWVPSRLTTVTLDAARRVIDPGLEEAGSAFETSAGVRVDHELYRNIILFAGIDWRQREFDDIDRDDDTLGARLGAIYKLNKRVHLEGYYRRRDRDSSRPEADFEQNILGLSLRVYP